MVSATAETCAALLAPVRPLVAPCAAARGAGALGPLGPLGPLGATKRGAATAVAMPAARRPRLDGAVIAKDLKDTKEEAANGRNA